MCHVGRKSLINQSHVGREWGCHGSAWAHPAASLGPAPGAPGAAGPERAPGDQYLANLSTPRITRWPLVVVIPPSVLYKLVKTPFTLGHHAYSAPQTAGRGPSDPAGTRLRAKHAYLLKCANADACFACTLHIGPASLQYGNTRASRAKVDKSCATKPRFV
mgnify:CR=1 FL=1